ncbi:ABC transporter ATP-binding protein [Brucella pseudogrignonensis]|uniref:ABC transporter ATP-binding protein n=1 Tax=Brucella pseudogrignonensis TaxID=419475 RepID=UPI0028B77C66|nr:ABC transporter ATP-binding protein [Brucella pseudogrignonensis]MDT6942264.1 ABC transporter ATP-binding protein [Brucella pseudogrignonensis]
MFFQFYQDQASIVLNIPKVAVELNKLVKRFGDVTAVHEISLEIEEGSFVTLLGPSGCGKTTTLRMIAGLLSPSSGGIAIKGKDVTTTPIHRRNLGIVFQNYALFPHKTIFDNVAFGLRYRSTPKAEIVRKVRDALELVQLPDVAERFPAQLSGGQQQRIALARAIVIEPDVLLLDEPLSALDANLRENMRVELKRIQSELGITTVFVTHDQAEALAMSDRIVVMRKGYVEQVGVPEEVYNQPRTEFVANFLGNSNLVPARIVERRGSHFIADIEGIGMLPIEVARSGTLSEGDKALVVIRAERLYLTDGNGSTPLEDDILQFSARVTDVDYQGQIARYFLVSGSKTYEALNMIDRSPFKKGCVLKATIRGRDCALIPKPEN